MYILKQLNLFEPNQIDELDIKRKIEFVDVCKDFKSNKIFKVASLFSGCGGMDLGFKGDFKIFNKKFDKNPFEIVFANDIVEKACETYKHNFKHSILNANIRDVDENGIPKADIVIGGFPCQDFSHAGKRKGLEAERGRLYLEMKRVIEHLNPIAFVAENVDGIRTSSKGTDTSALDIIIDDFAKSGYHVEYKALNAADYGVPQTRVRVIIIGVRSDYYSHIYYPKPVRGTHTNIPWMTAKEAIDDLWDKLDDPNIFNHKKSDYSKAKFYPGKKMQGNCQISADKPSMTIRAEHHGNIEGHYRTTNIDEPENMQFWRRLSVRECARIQTFPDDFEFPCAASSAYKLVGNAVPPVLGWHIARALYIALTEKQD